MNVKENLGLYFATVGIFLLAFVLALVVATIKKDSVINVGGFGGGGPGTTLHSSNVYTGWSADEFFAASDFGKHFIRVDDEEILDFTTQTVSGYYGIAVELNGGRINGIEIINADGSTLVNTSSWVLAANTVIIGGKQHNLWRTIVATPRLFADNRLNVTFSTFPGEYGLDIPEVRTELGAYLETAVAQSTVTNAEYIFSARSKNFILEVPTSTPQPYLPTATPQSHLPTPTPQPYLPTATPQPLPVVPTPQPHLPTPTPQVFSTQVPTPSIGNYIATAVTNADVTGAIFTYIVADKKYVLSIPPPVATVVPFNSFTMYSSKSITAGATLTWGSKVTISKYADFTDLYELAIPTGTVNEYLYFAISNDQTVDIIGTTGGNCTNSISNFIQYYQPEYDIKINNQTYSVWRSRYLQNSIQFLAGNKLCIGIMGDEPWIAAPSSFSPFTVRTLTTGASNNSATRTALMASSNINKFTTYRKYYKVSLFDGTQTSETPIGLNYIAFSYPFTWTVSAVSLPADNSCEGAIDGKGIFNLSTGLFTETVGSDVTKHQIAISTLPISFIAQHSLMCIEFDLPGPIVAPTPTPTLAPIPTSTPAPTSTPVPASNKLTFVGMISSDTTFDQNDLLRISETTDRPVGYLMNLPTLTAGGGYPAIAIPNYFTNPEIRIPTNGSCTGVNLIGTSIGFWSNQGDSTLNNLRSGITFTIWGQSSGQNDREWLNNRQLCLVLDYSQIPGSTVTATPTPVPTSIPTSTPTPIPTSTPIPIPTSTPTPVPTSTPTPVPTSTPTPIPTSTPAPRTLTFVGIISDNNVFNQSDSLLISETTDRPDEYLMNLPPRDSLAGYPAIAIPNYFTHPLIKTTDCEGTTLVGNGVHTWTNQGDSTLGNLRSGVTFTIWGRVVNLFAPTYLNSRQFCLALDYSQIPSS